MKSASVRGCAHALAVGVLLAASVVDVIYAGNDGASVVPLANPVWPTLAVALVGLAAVLWPAGRRPEWLTPQVRTAVPALASALLTAVSLLVPEEVVLGPGEIMILLSLLFIAVRHCPPRWAVVCGDLDAGALLILPVRGNVTLSSDVMGLEIIGLLLVGIVAGLAGYLRSMDYRRTVAVSETRRSERLAIAADLHDFVAHHVTGILVQTQVARMMATTQLQDQQQELDPVLAGIERAATEALASMRRTVGVLRDTGPEAADRRPVGDLAGIAELLDGFATPGQQVTLRSDPAVSDRLPHQSFIWPPNSLPSATCPRAWLRHSNAVAGSSVDRFNRSVSSPARPERRSDQVVYHAERSLSAKAASSEGTRPGSACGGARHLLVPPRAPGREGTWAAEPTCTRNSWRTMSRVILRRPMRCRICVLWRTRLGWPIYTASWPRSLSSRLARSILA